MTCLGPGRWGAIELRHLTTLDAVARERSFRRAAQRLGYVQSTVSQQVAALETLTGERLVERTRGTHSVSLTEAGRVLLARAGVVIDCMRRAETELGALRVRDGVALRVGRVDRLAAAVVPRLIACLRREHAAITVVVEDIESVAGLLERIEEQELEIGLCPLPLSRGAFESHELYSDHLVALVAKHSRLAGTNGPVSLRDLAALPLVGNLTARPWLEARVRADGLDPSFVVRCDDDAMLQEVAAADVGVAIVPRSAATRCRDDVAIIEISPEILTPVAGVVHSRRRSGDVALGAFVDAARAACCELGLADVRDRTNRPLSVARATARA
jgi:DNA-binding transcriptional LysR family regulator